MQPAGDGVRITIEIKVIDRMNVRLWALSFGNFAVGTGSLIVAGILPAVAAGLNISVAMAGQLVTIYGLALAIGAPLLGMATSHVKRRPLMLGGLAIFVLACLIGVVATNFTMLALSRAMAGVGAALFTPNAAALAAQLVGPEQRGRAVAVVFAGFSLASVIGVPLGTFMCGEFGWRSAFGLVAALALIAICLLAKFLPRDVPVATVAARSWLRLFRKRAPMLVVAATVLSMAGQYTLFTYIAALLARLHGLDLSGLSALLIWFGVTGMFGNALAGRVVDRIGATRVATSGIAVLAIAIFILANSAASLFLTIVAIGLWGAAAFAINSAQQARLVNQDPRLASATLALNTSALYVGQACGALLGGIAISLIGLDSIYWVGITMLTAALAVSILESLTPPKNKAVAHVLRT
jgi:predicted MFS family arabinose efflux permease